MVEFRLVGNRPRELHRQKVLDRLLVGKRPEEFRPKRVRRKADGCEALGLNRREELDDPFGERVEVVCPSKSDSQHIQR